MGNQKGNLYMLDAGYQSYCLTTAGNAFESIAYLSQGESQGGDSCGQVLTHA